MGRVEIKNICLGNKLQAIQIELKEIIDNGERKTDSRFSMTKAQNLFTHAGIGNDYIQSLISFRMK